MLPRETITRCDCKGGEKKKRISQINDVVDESLYELNNDDKSTRMTANGQNVAQKMTEKTCCSKSGSNSTELGVFN